LKKKYYKNSKFFNNFSKILKNGQLWAVLVKCSPFSEFWGRRANSSAKYLRNDSSFDIKKKKGGLENDKPI